MFLLGMDLLKGTQLKIIKKLGIIPKGDSVNG